MLTLENIITYTREFGGKHIAPYTKQTDEEGRFPKESFEALKKEGFTALLVPKEYGGLGGGADEHTKVCYELGRFCATSALCYMMHNTAVYAISLFGSEALKEEILSRVAKGEILLALAYSESGSGTHFGAPDITERSEGGYRILKGRKSFVTSAEYADYYLTYTNSCKKAGAYNSWLVDSTLPGVVTEQGTWNGLGMRGNNSKPVQYNDVRIEERFLLGSDGDGEAHSGALIMYFIIGLGAVYSGLGEAIYSCALEHTKGRKYTSGGALSDIELVKIHLADMYAKVQSAISLTVEAARSLDTKESDAALKVFACRINAIHNVMDVASLAMRLGGGKAYSKHLPLERYLRDAYASQVMAPSLDVLKVWLGNAVTA
ncbi:acyl-CoA dehydrogenase family protein [uncultured Helicobacter sp.]|uniref:acyl-CoA dehydrogenase family protein n=1 Tax=uncultured Helicobacter sp. TaxID=175537 RepID=UPI003752972C